MNTELSGSKLLDLFFTKNGHRRIVREAPLEISRYESIIKQNVVLKENYNRDFINEKYNFYLILLKQIQRGEKIKIVLSNIGYYSRTNKNAQYYIDRGWNACEAKEIISKVQSRTLTKKQHEKRIITWESNREKNINSLKRGNILCKEYYEVRGINEQDAKQQIAKEQSKRSIKMYERLKKEGKRKITNTCIEYYEDLGYTKLDAIEKISKRQQTCLLERFIERYGLDVGKKKWEDRIKKWKDTMSLKSDEEKIEILKKKLYRQNFFSKASYNFFQLLEETLIQNGIRLKCKYGEREFFIYDKITSRIYFYDFYIKDLNLVIEYNGSIWHPNKNLLSNEEWEMWCNPITKKSADEIYKFDEYKLSLLSANNISYIITWDTDCVTEKIKELTILIKEKYESYKK